MTAVRRVVAVDLGATSGRVMIAEVSAQSLTLGEVHRFPNAPVQVGDHLYWDVLGLYREVLTGLRLAAARGPVHGIGIDAWAVDYGLLSRNGELLGNPYCYRDARTEGMPARVGSMVGNRELYARTGLQQLTINTVYQLVAATGTPALEQAQTLLLLPDLIGYWLTGGIGAERTNASTTGLLDASTGEWAIDLAERLGIRPSLFPPLRRAGTALGAVLPDVADATGLDHDVPVIAVGSHDTASAVVSVPAGDEPFAYISSGTWSLVGLELRAPVLSDAARRADFTNEAGVDGTTRFLKNVMGLWVLSETQRCWGDEAAELNTLLSAAAEADPLRTVVDISHPSLLPPGDMPSRLSDLARRGSQPAPETHVQVVRCILDSLAVAYRRHVRQAAELAGQTVEVIHLVGGGVRNRLLSQLTADACGLPVLVGPAEASALGNVLVQARALGVALPDLAAMRALVRRSHDVVRMEPSTGLDWARAEDRASVRTETHDEGAS